MPFDTFSAQKIETLRYWMSTVHGSSLHSTQKNMEIQ